MLKSFLKANLEVMKNQKYQTHLTSTGTMSMNCMSNFVNDVFARLIEAGIPQLYNRRLFDLFPHHFEDEDPKVFTVADLSFGFEIWLIACGISTCAFLLEVLTFWVRELMGRIALISFLKLNI